MELFDRLHQRVDLSIFSRSGKVFYSGRGAFSRPSKIYLLGLNPGGNPEESTSATVAEEIREASARENADWSAYCDESWSGRDSGTKPMQRRVVHLLCGLDLNPRLVPASNVVFVRTASEKLLAREKSRLLDVCWPVHQQVIDELEVRVILCLGSTVGRWVRERIAANELVENFTEDNARRWKSTAHRNSGGIQVVTLSHPSRADWTQLNVDPTLMVRRCMKHA